MFASSALISPDKNTPYLRSAWNVEPLQIICSFLSLVLLLDVFFLPTCCWCCCCCCLCFVVVLPPCMYDRIFEILVNTTRRKYNQAGPRFSFCSLYIDTSCPPWVVRCRSNTTLSRKHTHKHTPTHTHTAASQKYTVLPFDNEGGQGRIITSHHNNIILLTTPAASSTTVWHFHFTQV